jgi:hypothetical protein
MSTQSLQAINLERDSWDEARFERLLRLVASLQGSLPAAAREAPERQGRWEKGPAREEIESRAYQLYLQRGRAHGRALEDWLRAERELLARHEMSDPRLRVALAFGFLKGL